LRDTAKRIPVGLVEELARFGTAAEIAARLTTYAEAGAAHVVLGDVTGTPIVLTESAI
jgi:phthiodiolone/phenolphthiodiolone dimycocerosates ketoreductase